MPKDSLQLESWYDTYNEIVKRKQIARWNRRFCKLYRLNVARTQPMQEIEVDVIYVTHYCNTVLFLNCEEYKHFDCTKIDFQALQKEAGRELLRLKRQMQSCEIRKNK